MARSRTTKASTASTNETKGKVMPLTNEQILELLSKTRQKGQYLDILNEFVTSEQAGVSVNDTWPALANKKATTIKQGFESAKDKKEAVDGADKVIVKADGDRVFLINLAHVEGAEVAA